MNTTARSTTLAAAVAAATASLYAPQAAQAGYQSGDFHNHTTCSDGSTSVQTLTQQSLSYLDWFIHVGHSGGQVRDCRLDDFAYNGPADSQGDYWQNTLPNGRDDIKGDFATSGSYGCGNEEEGDCQVMWRWQSLQEFNYPLIRDFRQDETAFLGLEWVVPGHEHSSNSIITDQYALDNADAIAQFEYCFARPSNDTSQGGGQGWTCEISEEANDALIARFGGDPDEVQGIADYNGTLGEDGVNIDDNGEHVKSVAAMYWMQENHPGKSFAVPAHLERAGGFEKDQNRGFNIEHLRDYNNAAPDVAFGFESQPGHQADDTRGQYRSTRPTWGIWTHGGTGCMAGGEASQPGKNFDGTDVTPEQLEDLGIDAETNPIRVIQCRPGVRTLWDALLSEGRRFWFFGSSDWHNRGSFGPFDDRSTFDFWPGEYQKNYTFIEENNPDDPAQDVVDALRSGNTWVVMGDLVSRVNFRACVRGDEEPRCATMGETLEIERGDNVVVSLTMVDPRGVNNSPYQFPNPLLKQVGITQPLNAPVLDHVDLIKGVVHGKIEPTDPAYVENLAPATTVLVKSFDQDDFGTEPLKRMRFVLRNVVEDSYIRFRGTNIPRGTPFETDENGNPLADNLTDNVPCLQFGCPDHLPVSIDLDGDGEPETKAVDVDVEAWADLWVYGNPIFIEVTDNGTKMADAGE